MARIRNAFGGAEEEDVRLNETGSFLFPGFQSSLGGSRASACETVRGLFSANLAGRLPRSNFDLSFNYRTNLRAAPTDCSNAVAYRVVYRETHVLLDELADAVAEGTCKEYMEPVAPFRFSSLDDFGMRKLPHTAAEDLLEIIMRCYASALCLHPTVRLTTAASCLAMSLLR